MTCIVGLIDNGEVFVGGDSAAVTELDVSVRLDKKVFIKDSMIFGFTSSFRMGQLLQYSLIVPKQKKGQDDMEYLTCDFVDAVRNLYKKKGFMKISGEKESGGTFILGYKEQLFVVDSDFQVGIPAEGFAAVGCGANYSLGSLHTTAALNLPPQNRVELALEAAAAFSGGVLPPFNIKVLGETTNKKSHSGVRKR
jgi:ATP-dependent protease HslVU (ClpYQ) peptidase subunit